MSFVKIGPIKFNWNKTFKLTSPEGAALDGHIRYSECVILTDDALHGQRETQVLWHEVVHGISDVYGIDLDEKQVEIMSNGIMQVLIDNQWLVNKTTKKKEA